MRPSCVSDILKQEGSCFLPGMSSSLGEVAFFFYCVWSSCLFHLILKYIIRMKDFFFFFFLDKKLHCCSLRMNIFTEFNKQITEDLLLHLENYAKTWCIGHKRNSKYLKYSFKFSIFETLQHKLFYCVVMATLAELPIKLHSLIK